MNTHPNSAAKVRYCIVSFYFVYTVTQTRATKLANGQDQSTIMHGLNLHQNSLSALSALQNVTFIQN